MLNVTFDGYVLENEYKSTETEDVYISTVVDKTVYYQGYFYSTDVSTSSSKWSDVRTVESSGYYNMNLGDADWLGQEGSASTSDKVLIVFWQGNADRTNPSVLNYPRGSFRFTLDDSSFYTNPVMLANTYTTYNYSDDVPARYGQLDYDYNFSYNSSLWYTYWLYEPLPWYNNETGVYKNTEDDLIMSHEDTVYEQEIYPTISGIRETLTFVPEDDSVQTTVESGTINFTHSFSTYQNHSLIRTMEYLVDGIYYEDPNVKVIDNYFVELVINKPAKLDINIYKDRTFRLSFKTDRVDWWSFKAQIRESFSSDIVLAEFDITTNASEETLTLELDHETTKSLVDSSIKITLSSVSTIKKLVWDLKITNPTGNRYNLIEGNCFLYNTPTLSS